MSNSTENPYSRGSEWRKWDLHVHTPGTKKNDQYKVKNGDAWDLFCEKVNDSDVKAFGICDYYSVTNYLTFIEKYNRKYPDSCKAFFPNIEVCTSDVVNTAQEEVNTHLIFNPDIPDLKDRIKEFLTYLKTNKTNKAGKHILASELSTTKDFEEATTTRKDIEKAFEETFGPKVDVEDYMIIITAANNDGIRTATEVVDGKTRGRKRKAVITDELDKFSHAFFGNSNNVTHFAKADRLETKEPIRPKPVVSGSDSHSFDDLDKFLGKNVIESGEIVKQITWIKADLTFEGLKQIIYEPISGERVFIGAIPPGKKSRDRVIRRIIFEDTDDFPTEVIFNENLSSIIGSRSSGKSALLAYLAYGVDKDLAKEVKPDGPAARISWDKVDMNVAVEWGDELTQQGKIIYIPQNYLNDLSRRPAKITEMIRPVLFSKYPKINREYSRILHNISETYNKKITQSVRDWFTRMAKIVTLRGDIKEVGDKSAIGKDIKSLEFTIEKLKQTAALDDNDVRKYKEISQQIHSTKVKLKGIHEDQQKIDAFVEIDEAAGTTNVIDFSSEITFEPSILTLPDSLQSKIQQATPEWKEIVTGKLKALILAFKEDLEKEHKKLTEALESLLQDNGDLIKRCKQNEELQGLIEELDKQKGKVSAIEKIEERILTEQDLITTLSKQIKEYIDSRSNDLHALATTFKEIDQSADTICFGVEIDFNPDDYENISSRFNRKEISEYINNDGYLKVNEIRNTPDAFLKAIFEKKQKVLYNQDSIECAVDTLSFVEEIRFSAIMEDDTIGGFQKSAMTEGKQALFALTLLLNKESDDWPLLIDQPEDDLDSRSIYELIVPYLKTQKQKRQIIMVSHNANLVVGADSEQIIVANQHGVDRKNEADRKFDYLSGALEFTKPRDESADIILHSRGIREHACDLLDGGESAFQKRQDKYNI